jgi:predicted 3-demethylubiquinone-9 3-methyltransferase (glyoxalase superfamily)
MKLSIYPCLWVDQQAQQIAEFYCSVFPNSMILSSNPMATVFELNGSRMMCLNGNTQNTFNDSTSMVITCDTQAEIDHFWKKLTDGGEEGRCGWFTDKFGFSWQVLPAVLGQLMSDPEKAPKAMYAFMQMKKFDIETLLNATK